MKVSIDVIGQKLVCNKREKKFVAGTQEFINFVFNLDESWQGLVIFAQFIQEGTAYNVFLDDENSAYLPAEITNGACAVCLQGNNGNTIAKSMPLFFTVFPDPVQSDSSSTSITLTLYDQLAAEMADIRAENALIKEEYAEMLERIEYAEAAALAANAKTFADVQRIVRAGLASKAYAIGDQFTTERATSIQTGIGDSAGITAATVSDEQELIKKLGTNLSGTFVLTYDGNGWYNQIGESVTLSNWGITVTGKPKENDEIVITVTASTLVWDVIGIDVDTPADSQFTHSLTLQLHDCITAAQVDASEYMFVANQELPAGTYHFKADHCGYGNVTTQDTATGYQFTITAPIPAGGAIRHSVFGVWQSDSAYTVEKALTGKFTTYDAEGNALESNLATTEGANGTYLGTLTARDPQYLESSTYGSVNFTERQGSGNNNWGNSAIRQWLNSDKAGNAWWEAQHVFDRVPSYANTAGFLHGLDADFRAAIGAVTKRTINSISDGNGYVDSEERFFLLSMTEVYCGNNNSIAEGTPYPYYSDYSDHSSPNSAEDSNRIKYGNGTATYWWLRSPIPSLASLVRGIVPSGQLSGSDAYYTDGVAPACSII